jgi:RHS repeat-associated protein
MRWQYDASHRLRRAMLPNGGTEEYSYDAAGNLLRAPGLTGVSLRTGNRLASANGDSFEYDGRDHLARRVGARDTHSYAYDSRGMLLRVERNGETFWDATYDALGRRVRKTSPLGSTEYFWDADQLAAEIDEHGRVRVYVYLDRLALAPFMFVDYRSVDADPASGLAFFIFSNQLGAPLLVEDVNGRIVWRCTYTAYGAAQIDPGSRIACHLRFPGHYFDGETGLHYNRFRYYSPELGRYLQADPEGIAGGLNLYAYTRNPLVDVDVRGLNCGAHGRGAKAKPDCEDCRDADPALREALEPTEPGAIKSPEELRAETARREAVLRATLSQDERGPCVSMVLDQETGQGFAGINRDAPPDDPHPIIQDRLDNPPEGGWRNPDEPGSHSEIHALDQALKARQERANAAADAAGIPRPPDPPISTDGLLIDNQRSRGANKGTPMPCCPNCTHITGGADPSQPGYIPSQAGKDPVGHTGGTPGAGGSSGDAGSGAADPPGGSGGSGSQADHVQNGAMGGGSGGEE